MSLVGIHSTVSEGQVNACEYSVSYRKGACFFQILYSSKILCSSISSTLSTKAKVLAVEKEFTSVLELHF